MFKQLLNLWKFFIPTLGFESGGSSQQSPTQQQTQITELPEWAKGYAQDTLAKGQALTAQPYIPYGGERYAGLSDLQKTAMASVASPEAYGKTVSSYMSPYMQNVVDIQKREAARQSDIQGTKQQAQATGAGAFGGYREAIERAERERNLGQQMNDIQERGLQSAFQGAESTFGRNLSAQTQLGGLQQEAAQRPLDIAYQDFMNQKNYPYKQLGFMSDLIRGTPTGSSSAMTMYQAPGSISGQLAGLGMGAYGLSRAFGAKEGGMVYAEGGVTSEQNTSEIISKLSDGQLKQAYQSALDRQDVEEANLLQQEMSERASMRNGLASIPIDFTAYMPDEESMANGGIVAFADEGLVKEPEEATSTAGDIWRSITGGIQKRVEDAAKYHELREKSRAALPGFFEKLTPTERKERMETARELGGQMKEMGWQGKPSDKNPKAPVEKKFAPPPITAEEKKTLGIADENAPEIKPAAKPADINAPVKSISDAVKTVTEVAKTKVPEDDTRSIAKSLYEEMMARSAPDREAFKAELDKAKGRAEEIKAKSVGDALMKFGFGMAAGAAKPGVARRSGLAGALEAGAAASPLLAESFAESDKLQQAAQDNYLKLRMENARYQSALDQGNMQLAATLAGNISQRKLQQAQLEEQIRQHGITAGLEEKKLDIMRSQASRPGSAMELAYNIVKNDPKNQGKSATELLELAAKNVGAASMYRSDLSQNRDVGKEVAKLRGEDMGYKLAKLRLDSPNISAEDKAKYQEIIRQKDADFIRQARVNLGASGGDGGVGSGSASQTYRFDAQGNPIQ